MFGAANAKKCRHEVIERGGGKKNQPERFIGCIMLRE